MEKSNKEINCFEDYGKDDYSGFSIARKESNRQKVEWMKAYLNDNNIKYEDTNIRNVVLLKVKDAFYYLSLKQSRGCFVFRKKGDKKWIKSKEKKFKKLFC